MSCFGTAGCDHCAQAANFVLVSLDGRDDVADRGPGRSAGILVRAGSEFQLAGHVRVTVAPRPLMERAAQELIAACRVEEAVV